jgi:hypothetical protein
MSHLLPLVKGNPSALIKYTVPLPGRDFKTGDPGQGKEEKNRRFVNRLPEYIIPVNQPLSIVERS